MVSTRRVPTLLDARSGQTFALGHEVSFIGRHRSCEVCIPIPEISRRHCRLYREAGLLWVQDLGSLNGTYVNDVMIVEPHPLRHGFRLTVGKCAKYPGGTRHFVVQLPAGQRTGAISAQRMAEVMLDPEVISVPPSPALDERGRIPLRDCLFTAGRRGEPLIRVPMLEFVPPRVRFLTTRAVGAGDTLLLNIDHPIWSDHFELRLRVLDAVPLEARPATEVTAEIVDQTEAQRHELGERVRRSEMVEYRAR